MDKNLIYTTVTILGTEIKGTKAITHSIENSLNTKASTQHAKAVKDSLKDFVENYGMGNAYFTLNREESDNSIITTIDFDWGQAVHIISTLITPWKFED